MISMFWGKLTFSKACLGKDSLNVKFHYLVAGDVGIHNQLKQLKQLKYSLYFNQNVSVFITSVSEFDMCGT